MAKFLILNGPNLNLLGSREPAHYGSDRLDNINKKLEASVQEMGGEMLTFQSNAEHELMDHIHAAAHENIDFIIFNPAGFTHTSVVLRDGVPGHPMTDGAFQGSNANANFNFNDISFPNLPPTANDFSRSTVVDAPVLIDLAAYATDSDGSIDPTSVAIVPGSGPSNGTLLNNGDGTVT